DRWRPERLGEFHHAPELPRAIARPHRAAVLIIREQHDRSAVHADEMARHSPHHASCPSRHLSAEVLIPKGHSTPPPITDRSLRGSGRPSFAGLEYRNSINARVGVA